VGHVLPISGFIVPVAMWLIGRDRHPAIDAHGRVVINWMLSELLYVVLSLALCYVLIGIPILILVTILSVVLPILGAVRAADGRLNPYWSSIGFLAPVPDGNAPAASGRNAAIMTGSGVAIGCVGALVVALIMFVVLCGLMFTVSRHAVPQATSVER
jgi:hypothetical protein